MANGDLLDGSEEVIRAAMHPYWDANLGRATPSAFTSTEVSVSRLAILDLDQIVSILKRDFNNRMHSDGESKEIRSLGRARVSDIIQVVDIPSEEPNGSLPTVVLTVVEDSIENENDIPDNPSHALICSWDRAEPTRPRKIPRGIANRLLALFTWETLSSEPVGISRGGDAVPS